ncbi:aspartic peptidase domain-containing protein [Rhizoctonia solani]|nr:aspartic peptidase domain-containing protein [Rhizoctonia solani]
MMETRPYSLFLATAALTALGLARAEMEFEGHWRRSTPGGPSTFVIPLAMDASGIYHSAVSMGSNDQKFNFSLSGSTGYTVVAGKVCNACGDQNPLYSSNNSSSFQSMNELIDITVDGVNQVFGNMAKENCALKQTNGNWWQYKNQTVLVAGSVNEGTRNIFNGQVSGVLGLAPTAKLHSYADTVLGAWLQRNPQAPKVSVGFALRRPEILNATTNGNSTTLTNSTNPGGGEMHMLAPDTSSYYGELATVSTVSYASSGAPTTGNGGGQQMQAAGWVTNLEEWTFLNPNGERVNGGKGAHAAVDPWYSSIIMPRSESENIFSKIPGSRLTSSSNDPQQTWNVPCNTRMNLTISIAGIDFIIDPRDLISEGQELGAASNHGGVQKRQDAMCACAVQGWTDPSVPGYMLGNSFMRNAYIVYNVAQLNGSQQNSIGFGRRLPFQPPSEAQTQRARTIGIVVGSIAGVIIILGGGALAWLWRRSQQKAHRAPSEEFMGASPKRYEYGGFRTVSTGLLGKAGGMTVAPGVIFNARRGSDPEAHPLMQTPPTTSSPIRPIKVHVEDTDREQGLHLPAHQAYLERISKSAENRGIRWPGSDKGYAPISDQDMDAHAFGDHANVYSDDSEYNPPANQRYDPPPEPASSSNWNQPYHPPSPSGANRVSMVVEPITKPAGVAFKEEPNQNKD